MEIQQLSTIAGSLTTQFGSDTESYLDISKIVVTKEKITAADREEEKLCFTINDTYRIDDPKELILLLMEIIVDMKSKQ